MVVVASAPRFHGKEFDCPQCLNLAPHHWKSVRGAEELGWLESSECSRCGYRMMWQAQFTKTLRCCGEIVHPIPMIGPPPPDSLPNDAKRDYEEARAVAARFPHAAQVLLQQVLRRLTDEFDQNPERAPERKLRNPQSHGASHRIKELLEVTEKESISADNPDKSELLNKLFTGISTIADYLAPQPDGAPKTVH